MTASPPATPALVVVDSRNIFHQTEAATGHRLRPTVEGVVDAMALYGFDALEVHVGLALPRSQDRVLLSDAAKENGAYKQQVESAPRGKVLLGELHRKERSGGRSAVEEKQVDVACAVDICRHATAIAHHDSPFKAIVVLSQDTDLTPAFRYAEEVNVPLVVAAHERVERRGFPYMLLTERAFRQIGRIPPGLAGHALRLAVATAVMNPDVFEDWTILGNDPRRERVMVENSSGLRGVVRQDHLGAAQTGDKVSLRVAGVDFGRRRNDFPLATCSARKPHPGKDHRKDFERRFVRRRRALTEIELDRDVYGKARLPYPAGGLSSRSEVLVDCTEPQRPIIVGPLHNHPARSIMQAETICVVPVTHHKPTSTFAKTAGQGRVLLSHSAGQPPVIGARYAAVLVEGGDGTQPVAKLISSPLP